MTAMQLNIDSLEALCCLGQREEVYPVQFRCVTVCHGIESLCSMSVKYTPAILFGMGMNAMLCMTEISVEHMASADASVQTSTWSPSDENRNGQCPIQRLYQVMQRKRSA